MELFLIGAVRRLDSVKNFEKLFTISDQFPKFHEYVSSNSLVLTLRTWAIINSTYRVIQNQETLKVLLSNAYYSFYSSSTSHSFTNGRFLIIILNYFIYFLIFIINLILPLFWNWFLIFVEAIIDIFPKSTTIIQKTFKNNFCRLIYSNKWINDAKKVNK